MFYFLVTGFTIINLLEKDDSYNNLYLDILKQCNDVLDAHYWLNHEEAFVVKGSYDKNEFLVSLRSGEFLSVNGNVFSLFL